MRESAVEAILFEAVKDLDGLCIKLMPTHAGIPDRIVLLPDGRHYLVELKQKGKLPSKIQKWWHEKAAKIGHPVVVLRGSDQVREWITTIGEN